MFESKDDTTEANNQDDAIKNEMKFKQYMERAQLDLNKINTQLSYARAELQSTQKIIDEKDQKILVSQQKLDKLSEEYERELHDIAEKYEIDGKKQERLIKEQLEQRLKDMEIEFEKDKEKISNEKFMVGADSVYKQLTPVALQHVETNIYNRLVQKQASKILMNGSKTYPRSYEEVIKIMFERAKNGEYPNISSEQIQKIQKERELFDTIGAANVDPINQVEDYYDKLDAFEKHIWQCKQLQSLLKPKEVNPKRNNASTLEDGEDDLSLSDIKKDEV